MSGWWLASYLVLWALILVVILVLLVVLRQLGLIYLHTRGGGGLRVEEGPPVGFPMRFDEIDLEGRRVRFPISEESLNLVLLTSPWCAICKDSLRGLAPLRAHHDVAVIVIDAGLPEETAALQELVDRRVPMVSSLERQRKLSVVTIPYGIVTDREGVILGKAIVNNIDDLEDLLEDAEAHLGTRLQPTPA